jgi:hypothetical protein
MGRHLLGHPTKAMLPYLRMYIPRPTSLHLFMAQLLHSGVLLSLSSPLKGLLLQLWPLAGIVLLLRSATRVYHLSS